MPLQLDLLVYWRNQMKSVGRGKKDFTNIVVRTSEFAALRYGFDVVSILRFYFQVPVFVTAD